MESFYHILLIDDEPLSSRVYAYMIKESELGTSTMCTDSRLAMGMIRQGAFDLVVLDLNMPYIGGKELLEQIALEFPDIPVLILTNEDKVETAVECMKRGAFDFMSKPIDRSRFISALRHALTIRELKRELTILTSRGDEHPLERPELFAHIITASPAMRTIFAYIEAIAASPKAVLITGESGTGKELIARVIHAASNRTGSFVPINVSGLDDTIFSDSLFGHLRGSYTGAEGARKGLVEQSRDGTLFLDEIGDLAPGAQVKLLRLLQEGEYYPLGSDKPMKSHTRIIAATNADLVKGQESGTFRKDLYYRLMSHQIQVPPLRERVEDIPLLAGHFVCEAAQTLGKDMPVLGPEVQELLAGYAFPGNIRELQALCFDAVSRCNAGRLDPTYFGAILTDRLVRGNRPAATGRQHGEVPPELENPGGQGEGGARPEAAASPAGLPPEPSATPGLGSGEQGLLDSLRLLFEQKGLPDMDTLENMVFGMALDKSGGSQTKASRLVGVSQSTLSRWVKKQDAGT